MKIKKSIGERLFDGFNILFMFFMIVICAYPLVYVVFGSFSEASKLIQVEGILWHPAGLSLEGYKVVFANEDLLSGYLNSIYYIVMGTSLSLLAKCFMAFNLSRPYLKHNKWIMKFMMVTMFFGGGLIPTFLVLKALGFYGSRWAVILSGLMSIYNLIVLKTSFDAVPHSLEESARIDGAGSMTVLFRIIIPLSMAAIAVQILFTGVGIWNSWFTAMIYLKDRRKFPIQLILREILMDGKTGAGKVVQTEDVEGFSDVIKYATIVVTMVPILCVYPFLQKHFAKGVMIGAVKG